MQISPQEIVVEANPAKPVSVQFNASLAENPVDIYFVMDLSMSMSVHKVSRGLRSPEFRHSFRLSRRERYRVDKQGPCPEPQAQGWREMHLTVMQQ